MGDSNSHVDEYNLAVLPRNYAVFGYCRLRPAAFSSIEMHGVSPVNVP